MEENETEEPVDAGLETRMAAFAAFVPRAPSDAEMAESALVWWKTGGETFYDQWPEALKALSAPTRTVVLDTREIDAILAIQDGPAAMTPELVASMESLSGRIEAALGGKERFVKLNSRSPKDASWPDKPLASSARDVVGLLSSSMRTFDDLVRFRHLPADKGGSILLRDFREFEPDSEVRAFVIDGVVRAASVYEYEDENVAAAWLGRDKSYEDRVFAFLRDEVVPACHMKTFVADVGMTRTGNLELVEINPYGSSDPCLFRTYAAVEAWTGGLKRPG